MLIGTSLFSILIHQNTKSTTVFCIKNIFRERSKKLLKISLIDVNSGYHQEAKTIKFVHLVKNYEETSQGSPNSVLKWRPEDGPQDAILKNTLLLCYFRSYFTEWVTWNTEKLVVTHCYSLENRPVDVLKTSRKDVHMVTSLGRQCLTSHYSHSYFTKCVLETLTS